MKSLFEEIKDDVQRDFLQAAECTEVQFVSPSSAASGSALAGPSGQRKRRRSQQGQAAARLHGAAPLRAPVPAHEDDMNDSGCWGGGGDYDAMEDIEQIADPDAGQQGVSGSGSNVDHRERMARAHQAFATQKADMRMRVERAEPAATAERAILRDLERQRLQHRIDESWQLGLGHGAPVAIAAHAGGCTCPAPPAQPACCGSRPVTAFTFLGRHTIWLPQYRCSGCSRRWEPAAVDFGFWPVTASMPKTWLDVHIIKLWHALACTAGLAATSKDSFSHLPL
jgi:hypothetical protein